MVLRLLALARGRVVPTSEIVDALWGGSAPANPTDQVAVLASRLRRTVGRERIEHVEHGYRLRFDWLDATALFVLWLAQFLVPHWREEVAVAYAIWMVVLVAGFAIRAKPLLAPKYFWEIVRKR